MRPRVAFATAPAATIGHNDTDRPLHVAACRAAGVDLDYQVWSDPGVRWDDYDLVVVRSTWDYLDHVDDFRMWLDRTGRFGILHNPAPVVAWNLDKRYLLELAGTGVPVIPTRVCTDMAAVATAAMSVQTRVGITGTPVPASSRR